MQNQRYEQEYEQEMLEREAEIREYVMQLSKAELRQMLIQRMIGLLFTAEPRVAEDFLKEVEAYEAEEELREQEHYEDLRRYVNSLSKEELRELYLEALLELEKVRERYW